MTLKILIKRIILNQISQVLDIVPTPCFVFNWFCNSLIQWMFKGRCKDWMFKQILFNNFSTIFFPLKEFNAYNFQPYNTNKYIYILGKNKFEILFSPGNCCPKPWPGAENKSTKQI